MQWNEPTSLMQDVRALQDPLAPRKPHFPAKAKRLICIFAFGGMSHIDTFDPKEELTKKDGASVAGRKEFDTMGCNVLALGPRHAMMVEGNPETERRMKAAGVRVEVFKGHDICRKGEGGPTCMTRPLVRA